MKASTRKNTKSGQRAGAVAEFLKAEIAVTAVPISSQIKCLRTKINPTRAAREAESPNESFNYLHHRCCYLLIFVFVFFLLKKYIGNTQIDAMTSYDVM